MHDVLNSFGQVNREIFMHGDGNMHIHVNRQGHCHGFPADRRFTSEARDTGCFWRSASAISAEACISATRRS